MDDKFGISTKNRSRKNFQNLEYAEFLRSLNLLTLETSENSVAFSRTSFRVMVIWRVPVSIKSSPELICHIYFSKRR